MSIDKAGETSEAAIEFLFGELLRYPLLSKDPLVVQDKYEQMGESIGVRLVERLVLRHSFAGSEPLDSIKFICKEFWECLFNKKMGTLSPLLELIA